MGKWAKHSRQKKQRSTNKQHSPHKIDGTESNEEMDKKPNEGKYEDLIDGKYEKTV